MLRIAALAIAVIVVALPQGQPPPANQQPPTFRTGIDVVQLDVTVLDKDRHPVRGLTAEDFTILDKGRPQPIVAFSSVDVPAPVSAVTSWMRDAPLDVVSNAENRRLVAIVMDDAYAKSEPDVTKRAKQIARNAVDQLGPGDLAAVVFTFLGRSQNFTADRSQLVQAIESYTPKMTGAMGPPAICDIRHRSCDVEALAAVASTLVSAPPGRKILILISGGRAFTFGEIGVPSSRSEGTDLVQLFADLQRANITVYAYDAHGLEVDGSMVAKESLYSFAESTGGRAVAFTNDPASSVADAFRESSTYYFMGFRTTASNEKDFHKVEVKVNRPGLQVHTRNGYYPPSKNTRAETINGIPSGDLPIYITLAPVAVSGRREAEVILATRMAPADVATTPRDVALTTTAYDSEGKPHGTLRQTMTIAPTAGAPIEPDLPGHFPLRPGRYMVRVAATSEGSAGSVFVDIDIPDFAKDPLSASGLILQRRPAPPIRDKFLSDLVPMVPTTHRQFLASDDVAVFVRIYQGGKGRIVPVRMTARVRNERNAVASNHEGMLEVENFSGNRSADFEVTLPLAHLTPGEYLLEVDAQSGARHVKRSARFTVVASR
jgi:VWFA-related protein